MNGIQKTYTTSRAIGHDVALTVEFANKKKNAFSYMAMGTFLFGVTYAVIPNGTAHLSIYGIGAIITTVTFLGWRFQK